MENPGSPREILGQVEMGMDIFVLPFIGEAADAGIALSFSFPAPSQTNGEMEIDGQAKKKVQLGIDLWKTDEHATAMIPLESECPCFACKSYTRAYVNHLLNAKELLAWVLLQVHNHAVMDRFFAGIRASIQAGTFEADKAALEEYYEEEIPISIGTGPRIRGYQTKSGPGQAKINAKAWGRFDGIEDSPAEIEQAIDGAEELAEHGMGQTK